MFSKEFDEYLLDEVFDLLDANDSIQKLPANKFEGGCCQNKKSTVKSKVMNFGGALVAYIQLMKLEAHQDNI